jgi:hypothetical protein
MRNNYLLCLIFLSTISRLFAQEVQTATKDFEISPPTHAINGSLYSSIDLIDSRFDKSQIGVVQLGAFNRKARVTLEVPFRTQLQTLVDSLTDASAANGQLLFHLRQLTFAEITGAMSEKGYCYLRAALYAKNDIEFKRLAAIDTVVLVKSMDVTKALFREAGKVITTFVANSLLLQSSDIITYRFDDIVRMDSVEKRKLPVYNTDNYTDGLYYNYQSFRNQTPDETVSVKKKKDGTIATVSILAENGEALKTRPKDTYAFVYEGSPYIATDYGFYPLNKTNDDFYFIGKTKVSANSTDVIGATLLFGIVGALLASDTNATFVMKVDHINGGFIHLREVKPTPQ